jgi:hypothetical protein
MGGIVPDEIGHFAQDQELAGGNRKGIKKKSEQAAFYRSTTHPNVRRF